MLQDELDRRRSRLTERRFKRLGPGRAAHAGRLRLALQPQAAAPGLLRVAHPEVHRRGRQRADHRQARHRQEPCRQGRGLPGHPAGLRRALRRGRHRVRPLRAGQHRRAGRAAAQAGSSPTCSCSTICSWPGASREASAELLQAIVHQRYKLRRSHRRHLQPRRAGLGQVPRRRHHGHHHPRPTHAPLRPCSSSRARATASRRPLRASPSTRPSTHNSTVLPGGV